MRTASEVTLPVEIDRDDPRPLPQQLTDGIRGVIAEGVISPGEPVPPSRTLALQLSVSRGTVVAAYDQLLAEGYLTSRGGRSTVVNPALARVGTTTSRASETVNSVDEAAPIDLRPGRPWTASIATPTWRRCWREAAGTPPVPAPPGGLPRLRTELADHLRRMRGVLRDPHDVVVTAGARDGLSWVLATRGPRLRIGVEDPGYPSLRRVPQRRGDTVIGLPADQHGLVCSDLPRGSQLDAIVVTPSHQYPLGGALPVARRYELLEWAKREGVWVIEDDYDAELRYSGAPLPPLAALDDPEDGRVLTLGTFAKTLTPGLGAGYLVAPRQLVRPLLQARADLGAPVGTPTQTALAEYLSSGELRRHVQRMRRLYRARRTLVVDSLSDLPGVGVDPMDGGLHAVVEVADEQAVLAELRARGVLATGLSSYWAGTRAPRSGVVVGFGGVEAAELHRGLITLAEVLRR